MCRSESNLQNKAYKTQDWDDEGAGTGRKLSWRGWRDECLVGCDVFLLDPWRRNRWEREVKGGHTFIGGARELSIAAKDWTISPSKVHSRSCEISFVLAIREKGTNEFDCEDTGSVSEIERSNPCGVLNEIWGIVSSEIQSINWPLSINAFEFVVCGVSEYISANSWVRIISGLCSIRKTEPHALGTVCSVPCRNVKILNHQSSVEEILKQSFIFICIVIDGILSGICTTSLKDLASFRPGYILLTECLLNYSQESQQGKDFRSLFSSHDVRL